MGYRVAAHAEGPRRHRARDRGRHRHDRARHVPQPAPRPARADGRQRPGARPDARLLLRRRRRRRPRRAGPTARRRRAPRRPPTWSHLLVDLALHNLEQADLTLRAAQRRRRRDRRRPRLGADRRPRRSSSCGWSTTGSPRREALVAATATAARRARPRRPRRDGRAGQARRPRRRRRRPARAAGAPARPRPDLARAAARRARRRRGAGARHVATQATAPLGSGDRRPGAAGDLVVADRQVALDEEAVVLGIEDHGLDLVAREAADRVQRVPEEKVTTSVRSPSSRRSIHAPRLPGVAA